MDVSIFESVVRKVGVGPFDVLLVGDGSGTTADLPAGWAVWLWWKSSGKPPILLTGVVSNGTNNYSEVYPYIHAIWYMENKGLLPPATIAVISDSEITVKGGNREQTPKVNLVYWGLLDLYRRKGYRFEFCWQPRCSNPLLIDADQQARERRVAFKR